LQGLGQRRRRGIVVETAKKIFQAPSGAAFLHHDELQKYITGIVSAQKHKLIAINNMPDHARLYVFKTDEQ
jgi:hypothetical protein